ncbi:ABC transporter C-terminal domain-containing protein [Chitinophaga sedimenti]|uniref:ABC transporter C-terminal domain-containing protein n=1 Tax=Chitinophaga sedimenti TaxID=2033606 RepID=UPI00200316FC|nr:ABC transporter C-terminal domain-containing protein [Chitinophaga sedimenti]MCK7558101.1 ABC transporter C-terminal domain-containing protein [Chitinophaga sedimenti]
MSFKEKREMELLEKDMEALENEKKQLDEQLASGSLSYDQLQAASARIGVVMEQLDEKGLRWLELSELA